MADAGPEAASPLLAVFRKAGVRCLLITTECWWFVKEPGALIHGVPVLVSDGGVIHAEPPDSWIGGLRAQEIRYSRQNVHSKVSPAAMSNSPLRSIQKLAMGETVIVQWPGTKQMTVT